MKNGICLVILAIVLVAAMAIDKTFAWGVADLISAILVYIMMARPDNRLALAAHDARVEAQQARELAGRNEWGETLRNN